MKVYDCFIFNNELDLLELRLNFLDDVVDHFVLVESERTLSGLSKPLQYQLNNDRFSRFRDKIIHIIAPLNDLETWEYEFFQRNYIKKGLEQCADDDIIFISDADEIINIKAILADPSLQLPVLIELPVHYYFLNVRSNYSFFVNLAANWSFIKQKELGFRNRDYPLYTDNRLRFGPIITGWHFSYLFGYDTSCYQEKIRSFSHQEFNTPYYLDAKRIKHCIELLVDIFERPSVDLTISDDHTLLMPYTRQTGIANLLYDPSVINKMLPGNILFMAHKKFYRKIKSNMLGLFNKKNKGDAGQF